MRIDLSIYIDRPISVRHVKEDTQSMNALERKATSEYQVNVEWANAIVDAQSSNGGSRI